MDWMGFVYMLSISNTRYFTLSLVTNVIPSRYYIFQLLCLHYEEAKTVEKMSELLMNLATSRDVIVLSVHCSSLLLLYKWAPCDLCTWEKWKEVWGLGSKWKSSGSLNQGQVLAEVVVFGNYCWNNWNFCRKVQNLCRSCILNMSIERERTVPSAAESIYLDLIPHQDDDYMHCASLSFWDGSQ